MGSSPTTTVALPPHNGFTNAIPTISGAVADNTGLAGVLRVELSVQSDTGLYYDGAGSFN